MTDDLKPDATRQDTNVSLMPVDARSSDDAERSDPLGGDDE